MVRSLAVALVLVSVSTLATAQSTPPEPDLPPNPGPPAVPGAPPLPEHPSLAAADSDQKAPIGPVSADARTFYAVGADLLELSPEGTVLHRARFPAAISRLDVDAHAVKVTIRPRSDYPANAEDLLTIHYEPGNPGPSEPPWGNIGPWLRARRDAVEALKPFGAGASHELPEARLAEAADRLATLGARDPTNPYYAAFRGELLQRLGRTDDATEAYAAAAEAPAVWADLLRVSTDLENAGASAAADRAFARGLEAARATRIPMDSLLASGLFLGKSDRALTRAAAAKDVDGVHRILSRYASAFPRLELGSLLWRQVAAWMTAQGRADLAAVWEQRAAAGADASSLMYRQTDGLDVQVPWAAGLLWAAVGVAFLCGLTRGARQRADAVSRAWLPRPRAVDIIAVLLPLVAGLLLTSVAADGIRAIGRFAASPAIAFQTWGAPDARRWVEERLSPSDARTALLEHGKADQARVIRGDTGPRPELPLATVAAAFEATSTAERLQAGAEALGVWSQITDDVPGWLGSLRILPMVILAILCFLVGGAIGAAGPVVARWLARLVPGGAVRLGGGRGLVLGTVLGAAIHLRWPHSLGDIAIPRISSYVGAPFLPDTTTAFTTPVWPWLAIAAALAAHIAALAWERRHP